jgi:drug/metabolite transporter (DMT)-like permease
MTAPATKPVPRREIGTGMAVDLALFILMSLIWGGTWAAVKAGVTAVPPIFFAGTRFVLISVVLVLML